ncbi:OmpA family protein [Leptothrix ochracea]
MRLLGAVAVTCGVLWLGGCATNTRLEPPAAVEDRRSSAGGVDSKGVSPFGASTAGVGLDGVQTSGVMDPSSVARVQVGDPAAAQGALRNRVIYFDFNSDLINDEGRNVIEVQARYLKASHQRRMLVEGHTDERGGREFNLALGQRRANAVVRALQLLNVAPEQLEGVSSGKERPATPGHDEASWAKNRRVELKDQ